MDEEEYVVHYRESPNDLQWDETFATKPEADRRAYEIYVNGGIAVVVPVRKAKSPDMTEAEIKQELENPDAD